MDKSVFFYVVNWKMEFSFRQALLFYNKNRKGFEQLSNNKLSQIILCPSFDVLYSIKNLGSSIFFGGQTCSSHKSGAFTGEVSAKSLSEIGCKYCLVGHSDRRRFFSETDEDVATKVVNLIDSGVIPIICVGETKKEYDSGEVNEVINRQVKIVCKSIISLKKAGIVFFAYEPIWSIGTGNVPSNEYIEKVFSGIYKVILNYIPEMKIYFLYGGSVDEKNISILKGIDRLDGFLIGRSGLNFQKFKKIVT